MKVKIKDLFNIYQGHQITDEEIYNSVGEIPIFTSNNIIKGYGENSIISEEDLPCITYPTKGKIGNFYIQDSLFDANNTAILTLKNEWKGKLNLFWFLSHISSIVKKEMNSKNGVGYIGKDIMENIEIDVIPINEQNEIGELYWNIRETKNFLENKIEELEDIISLKWDLNSDGENIQISDLFDIYGGQSNLTEEFIYNNSPKSDDDSIKVFSGSTSHKILGYISSDSKLNNNQLKIFKGPCILIVRKGKAGHMFHIKEEKFVINDDAYVMYPKENMVNKINLVWFINFYQDLFINISSKSDNGTFSKNHALNQIVNIYPIEIQNLFANNITNINKIIKKFKKYNSELDKLLDYQIIF